MEGLLLGGLWILAGILATYLIWRFDKEWDDITGWNLLWIFAFSPLLLIYGVCMTINSIHIPSKSRIDEIKVAQEPTWLKEAKKEAEQIIKS